MIGWFYTLGLMFLGFFAAYLGENHPLFFIGFIVFLICSVGGFIYMKAKEEQ
jgi:hypothetical protein